MHARDPFLWQRDGTDGAGRPGREDLDALAFFPGMNQPAARELAWLAGSLDEFEQRFEVVPPGRHAEALEAAPHLPLRARRSPTRRPHPSGSTLQSGGPAQQEDAR